MNLYDAIRVKALLTVYSGNNSDYIERHLHRWYSQTFHTPLAEVQDIPLTEILVHLFETEFENLSPGKRLKEMKKILNEIQSGQFVRDFMLENAVGQPSFKAMRRRSAEHQIEEVGGKLRAMMPWIAKNKLVDKTKN